MEIKRAKNVESSTICWTCQNAVPNRGGMRTKTTYGDQKRRNILYIPVHVIPDMPWYINALGVYDDFLKAIGEVMIQIENTMEMDNHDEPLGMCSPLQYNSALGTWYIEAKDHIEKDLTDYYYILEVDKDEE